MVKDKKGGNHKLLNSFNGVRVFALRGCDPGYKTLFTLVLMQVYFNLNISIIVRSMSRS